MLAFECAFPCLLSAQLFKVQVNLSWWLAVWSQEVASVRGGELWRVVCGSSRGIRHWGTDTKRLRSTPYHGSYNTSTKMLHTDAGVPCSLSHLNYMPQIVQETDLLYPSDDEQKAEKAEFLFTANGKLPIFVQVWSKCVWGQPCRVCNDQCKIRVSMVAAGPLLLYIKALRLSIYVFTKGYQIAGAYGKGWKKKKET